MTDSRPSAASEQDYPAFPFIRQKIGENPARFLTQSNDLNPIPRIDGIHDLETLEAWMEVELELGPRKDIIARLNQQKQYIQEAEPGLTRREFFADGTPEPAAAEVDQAVATDGGEPE